MLRVVDLEHARRAIIRLGFETGHKVSQDRALAMAERLVEQRWTGPEIDLALSLILSERALLKQISYERTIGPGVFAEAREDVRVKAGRLFVYAAAVEMAAGAGCKLTEAFEAVHVEGEAVPRWTIIAPSILAGYDKGNDGP